MEFSFKGIGQAKTFESNPWLPENGSFVVDIQRCVTNSGIKGNFYIIEFEIVESDHPQMRPGTLASQRIKMNTSAPGNIKNFLKAAVIGAGLVSSAEEADEALGCEYDKKGNVTRDNGQEVAIASVSEDNPFANTRLRVRTKGVNTKTGGRFTVHSWSPVE